MTTTNTSSTSNASLWIPFGCGKIIVAKRAIDLLAFIAVTVIVLSTDINIISENIDDTLNVPLYFLPFVMTIVIYVISFCFKIYKAVTSNTGTSIGLVMQLLVKATQML